MDISLYFKQAIESKASDLHLVEGCVPALRVNGELVRFKQDIIKIGELRVAIKDLADEKILSELDQKKDVDISHEFYGFNFRINIHKQEDGIGLAARLIADKIPSADELDFSEVIYKLTHLKDGLILVTGPTGTGKSTTLAAMIDIINAERRSHIITIEDPIEFKFIEKQSIIEQRQLGRDTDSFASALKFALRQDPNVIMVGEIRDQETIDAALSAAKTGHLVVSTLHTTTAAETIERIVDFFPPKDHMLVAHELSTILRAVVSQQLLPRKGGGMVAAREVLVNNNAISNLIRNGQIEQINNAIVTGRSDGMITMNKSIDELLRRGLITQDVARNRTRSLDTSAAYY